MEAQVRNDTPPAEIPSSLSEILQATAAMGPKEGLDKFAASLDPEWIEQVLTHTGNVTLRRRRLPAEQTVWLILGMCLFTARSIKEVADHLGLAIQGTKNVAPSNLSKARERLGPETMRWLFEKVATTWGDTPGFKNTIDLSLYAIDGTQLRVHDTDDNFTYFGKPGGRAGPGDAGYPQVRLAALMNLSNRLITGAEFGPLSSGEQTLAKGLTTKIPDNSLTIVDRGFYSYMWINELLNNGGNRHVMVRARKNLTYEIVEVLPDGSTLARVRPHDVLRKKCPELPDSLLLRVVDYKISDGESSRLFVSLVDHQAYPAQKLIDLYHERWEIEIGFDEIKTHMLERKECLRSKKPSGVAQELWGQLLAYNLVRREMLLVAQAEKLPPRRISFTSSLHWIQNFWITAAMTSSPGTIPKRLAVFRCDLSALLLPPRRSDRKYARHVKIKMSKFKRNRGSRDISTAQIGSSGEIEGVSA